MKTFGPALGYPSSVESGTNGCRILDGADLYDDDDLAFPLYNSDFEEFREVHFPIGDNFGYLPLQEED
jgi:hypothetical protein